MSHTVHEIQRFLYQQVRQQPSRPFDRLMRHVTDWTVLKAAWQRVRSSNGANTPGADQVAVRDLPSAPAATRLFLQDLADQLQSGKYRPGPVRRFEIAKPNQPGKTRPIAILNVSDRVVHMALKLVLEPIVEARLGNRCFGFRPGRGRYDQLQAVRRLVVGHPDQYGAALAADIASCFDELDHRLILDDLRGVVADPDLTALFHLLLEQVGSGRTGWWRQRRVGVLQGSPLSPLLANWTLSRFDRAWQQRHGDRAPLFRYADDLLLLARDETDAARLRRPLEQCLGCANRLNLAGDKTRVGTLDQGIRLLGLMVRRHHDPFADHHDVRIFLDPAQFRTVLAEVEQWVERLDADRPLGSQFARFNQRLRGWFATYQYAYDAAQAFEALDRCLFVAVRKRLKDLLGCTGATLQQQHHRRLPSGHDTWQADGVSLLTLSALPRQCYRPKLPRSPWEVPVAPAPSPTQLDPREVVPLAPSLAHEPATDPLLTAILRQAAAKAPRRETVSHSKEPKLIGAAPASNGQPHPSSDPEGPSHASS